MTKKLALLLGAVALLAVLVPASAVADTTGDPAGAQGVNGWIAPNPPPNPAPDSCRHLRQLNPDEQKYRTVNNVPWTYTAAVYGANWFNVACADLFFTVPAGQTALVDLLAVAELDCRGPAGTFGWCGGRWLINGQPLPLPDNTGRPDSYAWDTASGGSWDWQAHTLAQEYVAVCTGTAPCNYRAQLQSQLANGSTSVWIDDLTTRVDVSEGPVGVAAGPPTP